MFKTLNVSSSPHIHSPVTTSGIMFTVIMTLLPVAVYGTVIFGIYAAAVIAVCILSAVLSEFIWNKILKKPDSLKDFSAVLTGLLLALNLPPRIPLWMAALGSAVAIIVVKQMFGGLGQNFVNPAIAARIVLMVSFPAAMTTFYEPLSDTVSSATPLASAVPLKQLFFGMHSGCIGETSFLLIAICGIALIIFKIISPVIPLCFVGSVFVLSFLLGQNPFYAVMSGGLMIGAFFMATDYVTSPTYPLGKVIFGVGCGIITVIIRTYASLPEGVSYSILLMNLLVPYIDRLTQPKPFGKAVR